MKIGEIFLKTAAVFYAPVRYVEMGVHQVKENIQQVKENIKDDVEGIVANLVRLIFMALVSLLFIIFLSAMVALLLNQLWESSYLGFAVVAGFYLLVLVILYVVRKVKKAENVYRAQARSILRRNMHTAEMHSSSMY